MLTEAAHSLQGSDPRQEGYLRCLSRLGHPQEVYAEQLKGLFDISPQPISNPSLTACLDPYDSLLVYKPRRLELPGGQVVNVLIGCRISSTGAIVLMHDPLESTERRTTTFSATKNPHWILNELVAAMQNHFLGGLLADTYSRATQRNNFSIGPINDSVGQFKTFCRDYPQLLHGARLALYQGGPPRLAWRIARENSLLNPWQRLVSSLNSVDAMEAREIINFAHGFRLCYGNDMVYRLAFRGVS